MSTALPVVHNAPAPGAGDRLSFTFFLACCLHALVLLGVGFVGESLLDPQKPVSLDVVLAQNFSKTAPKDPDFLAQANQIGGGSSKKAKPPRSTAQAEMPAPQATPEGATLEASAKTSQAALRAITSQQSSKSSPRQTPDAEQQAQLQPLSTAALMQRSLQIAALSAELAAQQEMEAKEPRKRIVAPSTASASDALYLDAWRRQVEQVGNLHYPEEAKRRAIFGSLMLRVDINPNGTVREVKIIQGSGSSLLDQAALRIVRLAAPFPPLPPEIRKNTDVLQIVRTWYFEPDSGFQSR